VLIWCLQGYPVGGGGGKLIQGLTPCTRRTREEGEEEEEEKEEEEQEEEEEGLFKANAVNSPFSYPRVEAFRNSETSVQ